MKFIRTDRGDYVSMGAIQRIEREPLVKAAGKPDDGIRVFRFYNASDEPLGAIRVTEDRMDLVLRSCCRRSRGKE